MLKITQTGDILTGKDIFTASKKTMEKIPSYVVNIKQKFVDNTIITPRMLKNVLHDKKISLTTIQENGVHDDSQNDYVNKDYRLNLTDEPQYVFNDNCGNSEEKQIIKYFKTVIEPKLKEKDLKYYLI